MLLLYTIKVKKVDLFLLFNHKIEILLSQYVLSTTKASIQLICHMKLWIINQQIIMTLNLFRLFYTLSFTFKELHTL